MAAAVSAAFGQAVNTYLPPEILYRTTEHRSSLMQLGMFDLNPHMAVTAIYDDNIDLSEDAREQDLIWVLSPGFEIAKNPTEQDSIVSTRLTYNPAFVIFTDHGSYDSIDHFLHWIGDLRMSRLSVSLSQDYESSAGGVVDVGSRVDQNYYLTSGKVRYDVSEKTALEISGSYRIREYETLIGSSEWLEDNAVHYQFSPKVRLGLGVSVGQLIVDDTPFHLIDTNGIGGGVVKGVRKGETQTFVTPSVRAAYQTTEKTDVALSVGGEWRSYEDGTSRFGPVFSLAGTYRPWEHTTFTVEGHRREQNSAVLDGQDFVTTGFSVGASRTFRERYRLRANLTYDNADYRSTERGINATRQDDYFLLRSGVDAIIAMNWTVGVFHQYRINESNSTFDFENHQAGVQAVWSY